MFMKQTIRHGKIRNLMTLAVDSNDIFFTDSIFYLGYHCLCSAAIVEEEILSLNLKKGQIVLTSPVIDKYTNHETCTIYKKLNIDPENGLLIPIISWALAFSKHMISQNTAITLKEEAGLVEVLLKQVWESETATLPENHFNSDLRETVAWPKTSGSEIRWKDYDLLVQAEEFLKNGAVGFNVDFIPHAHSENIHCFRKQDVKYGVIFDW